MRDVVCTASTDGVLRATRCTTRTTPRSNTQFGGEGAAEYAEDILRGIDAATKELHAQVP